MTMPCWRGRHWGRAGWSAATRAPAARKPDDARTTAVKALLKAHGERFGVGVSAVAYAWVMAHPSRPIPIVGTQTPARIAEAADAFKVSFTRAEWYAILVASLGENLP
jgi:predicted oxidoreductase